ncbi:MAG: YebC/PmpR family DNA-binding transcriptional regulator [bacterium]
MSGHSKWATIKHKKAKEDSKRGKIFTRLIRELTVAAREGGGDPSGNAKLRLIIEKAKAVNMPKDNIDRAIKKGTGEIAGTSYENIVYEGYTPAGVAVIIEVLTDNRKRAVADVRHVFSRLGGNLAEAGSVSWMFEHKGVIRAAANGHSEDEILEKLIDYEVDDVSVDDGIVSIYCDQKNLENIKKAVEEIGLKIEDAQIEWVAKTLMSLEDKNQEEKVYKFLEQIEELDDVQNVYTNLS